MVVLVAMYWVHQHVVDCSGKGYHRRETNLEPLRSWELGPSRSVPSSAPRRNPKVKSDQLVALSGNGKLRLESGGFALNAPPDRIAYLIQISDLIRNYGLVVAAGVRVGSRMVAQSRIQSAGNRGAAASRSSSTEPRGRDVQPCRRSDR